MIRQIIEHIRNSLERNFRVVREQWGDYAIEVKYVILPGIANAPWYRKPHKTFAFVEEWFDKMPRISAYFFALRWTAIIGFLIVYIVRTYGQ